MTRPLPPMLPADPAILCVWCVQAAYTARAEFRIQPLVPLAFAILAESTDRRGDDSQPGEPLVLHERYPHRLQEFSGWPLGWSVFLAELLAQPVGSWRLEIDMIREVGVAGIMCVSGTHVCAVHLQAELNDRRNGYRR